MSSSIEFGVFEEWSTISLAPKYRVDFTEDEFAKLKCCLDRIHQRTGVDFDLYSSAEIGAAKLDVFIEEFERFKRNEGSGSLRIIDELLRCAQHAKTLQRALQYRGL